MAEAHIEIRVGSVEFVGKGEQEWVSKQLDKILSKAEELMKLAPPAPSDATSAESVSPSGEDPIASATLPAFLAECNAQKPQRRKFLATAVWLHAKGQDRIRTADVTAALKDAKQSKLGNASDHLNKNVAKGYCEKDGKAFYVTPDGRAALK